MELTQSELKKHLSYDHETGVFLWIKSFHKRRIGMVAGSHDRDGYLSIKLHRKPYRAHRLAWLYVYGSQPTEQIDHRNGVRDDNRIANLREVTFAGNSQNQRKSHADSAHGLIGIDKLTHRNLFRARINVRGKRRNLGYFRTADEAHAAYVAAKRELHPTCTI
jgi:hypothetical protein